MTAIFLQINLLVSEIPLYCCK